MTNIGFTNTQVTIIAILAIWSLFWEGLALWHAANKKDKLWFIVLLLVNTLGILDILYLFIFSKRESPKK